MASRIAGQFKQTDGRDKFCKSVQYLSRLGMFLTKESNPEASKRFEALFKGMADARKLFRLFKWINEYQTAYEKLHSPPTDWDEIQLIGNILTRVAFAGFWAFDNLFILAKLKVLKKETDGFRQASNMFWSIGLILNILLSIRKLIQLKKEAEVIRKLFEKATAEKKEALTQRLKGLKTNIIRHLSKENWACQQSVSRMQPR